MSGLAAVIGRLAADLETIGRRWCVIGGLAVSARTEPRFTRDVDVAVAVPGDPDAESVVHRLIQRGYRTLGVIEQQAVGRLATVRLVPPLGGEEGVVADLLFASSGIEDEVTAAAERLELFPRVVVPVATIGHLLALKVLSFDDERRPQDRVDIVALLREAGPDELARARTAVDLIVARGAHRGRDLRSLFDGLVARAGR